MIGLTYATGLAIAATLLMNPGVSAASPPSGSQCGSGADGSLAGVHGPGYVGVSGACGVTPTDLPGNGGSPVLVIDCGYATATDDHTHWNPSCGVNVR